MQTTYPMLLVCGVLVANDLPCKHISITKISTFWSKVTLQTDKNIKKSLIFAPLSKNSRPESSGLGSPSIVWGQIVKYLIVYIVCGQEYISIDSN